MKYARIIDTIAIDVRTESPKGFFVPEVVAEFVDVPDEVQDGWRVVDGVWTISSLDPAPALEPAPPEPPKLSPVQFKMCFTAQERIAIKALRATNPVIEDAYEVLDDPRLTTVDLSLASNQAMIDYLVSLSVLTAGRAAQVKAGVML